jgi:hypothetical protein
MSNMLFPDPPPAAATNEPPVWVRRVVLLRQLEPEIEIIREIPFGLGLNLIITKQPSADSVESLGHDVGKTLLTRLIRYLLGEARCTDIRTRTAIRRALSDSIVAGEFRVGGEDWAVMRPLGAPATFVARARRASSWRELLTVEGSEAEYTAFVQQVADTVLASVSSPLLTSARRPIEWFDVLAWIARDQKCRYSHPLVWRHAEADSGTPALHIEDASTVLRSVSGLMDAREKVMFEEHDDLLDKRQTLAQEKTRLERQIEAEESGLKIDLQELLKADNVGISELELEVIRGKTQTMKDLRADEINKLNVASLRGTYEAAVQEDADAAAKEKSLAEQIDAVSAHIKKREERPLSVYERFAAMCDRQTDDCPAKLKIANQQVPTPDLDDVAELKTELEEHRKRLAEVQGSKSKLREALETNRSALSEAEKQVSSLTAGIDGQIALYEAMEKRVDRQIGRMNRLTRATKEHDDKTGEINQSLVRQAELRDALAASRAWLPMRFSTLCKELMGGSRQFELSFEAKAIRLNIVGASGAPGEATSTSALVLSLDLAAIQSAIDGYGHHPRLMILDSPREADMEIGIFNRLMRRLAAWHKASTNPAFQMIVTTTTKPQETDVPSGVVRAELSRLPPEELLLGVEL